MYTEEELAEMRSRELANKKQFVEELGKLLSRYKLSISKLTYDTFTDVNGIIHEYLVVTYKGGAIAVRNCRGNSLSAVFREMGELIDGGYYDEVEAYKTYKASAVN